eukprot:653322-Hanusia_phi.AAC.1
MELRVLSPGSKPTRARPSRRHRDGTAARGRRAGRPGLSSVAAVTDLSSYSSPIVPFLKAPDT